MRNMVVEIIGSGMSGEGVARVEGKVVFIPNAVQGDLAEVEIVKENKSFCWARLVRVIEESENRRMPKCRYYGTCGGCSMQHIAYEKTLEIKKDNIQSLFNKAKLKTNVEDVVKSNREYGYRNKLTMYLSRANSLGFYQKNSKSLIEINSCELVDEKFNNLINKLNIFFQQNKEFNSFIIKGVAIREINGFFIFNFILSKKINFLKMENYLKLNKIKYSLNYCINSDPKSNIPRGDSYFVGGEEKIILEEFGIKYPVYPMSFLQVNNDVKADIYGKILSLIESDKIVLDAYSGAGLLSAVISQKSKRVFAIEIEESACKACEDLCKINKIKNLTSICGDCTAKVPELLENTRIDIAILDPNRKGVDDKTLKSIISASPEKIIYLSCNPATLVRDLKTIIDSVKYKINLVQPYDMFPNTSEVETLVCLEKE